MPSLEKPEKDTVIMPRGREVETRATTGDTERSLKQANSGVSACRQFGDYDLIEEIGRGAMGVVYKARQRKLNRIVALKLVLASSEERAEATRQLYWEAEAAAQMDHSGVVAIHDVGEWDGHPYICMTFVDGESLAARIARSPIPPLQAARIVAQIAEALQHAHNSHILHRDLKPSNILLDRGERPRITDFGLATRMGAAGDRVENEEIVGTPAYMSPEQARGDIQSFSPTADVYSLGALLYELLTRRPPFEGESVREVLQRVGTEEPSDLRSINPAVPAGLAALCRRCLEKNPAARFQSAAELALALSQM